jgi:hypothetical protein
VILDDGSLEWIAVSGGLTSFRTASPGLPAYAFILTSPRKIDVSDVMAAGHIKMTETSPEEFAGRDW